MFKKAKVQTMTTVLVAGTVLYAAYICLLFFTQDRLLFLPHIPSRTLDATPSAIGLEYENLTINTPDDVHLDAWFIRAPDLGPTLLFFHGNAGNISHRLDSIAIFHKLGLNICIIDYRGYGRSTGQPSEQGVYRDAEAVWHYLTQVRRIDPHHIVLFGRSLGGAIAAWLAARTRPAAVIIESSFTSVPDLAAKLYPLAPVRLLTRLQFDTLKIVQSIQSPLLVIHSQEDEIIPFAHGKAIYEAAKVPKRLIELHGEHNDGFIVTGKTYSLGLQQFFHDFGILNNS